MLIKTENSFDEIFNISSNAKFEMDQLEQKLIDVKKSLENKVFVGFYQERRLCESLGIYKDVIVVDDEEVDIKESINHAVFTLSKLNGVAIRSTITGSKRSAHSNAYFYGFYKNKRIVLFDTLLKDYVSSDDKTKNETKVEVVNDTESVTSADDDDASSAPIIKKDDNLTATESVLDKSSSEKEENKKGCTNDEVLAVLAHELGHWKGNHILKQMILSEVNLFFLFMAFSALYQYGIIYRAFGFYDTQPVLMGLLIIIQFVFTPYHFILQLLATFITRKYEFEADSFANSLGKGEFLKKSLIKLNQDNLGFPIYDWLYSMFNHSHPPLLERMRAIDEKKNN